MAGFLIGAALGGLVGAALALLFAPGSGEDMRLEFQNRTEHIQSQVQEAARARRAELEQQLAALRSPQHPGA
jgi:gas vesicle protein